MDFLCNVQTRAEHPRRPCKTLTSGLRFLQPTRTASRHIMSFRVGGLNAFGGFCRYVSWPPRSHIPPPSRWYMGLRAEASTPIHAMELPRRLARQGILVLLALVRSAAFEFFPFFLALLARLLVHQGFHVGKQILHLLALGINGLAAQRLFYTDIDDFGQSVLVHAHDG